MLIFRIANDDILENLNDNIGKFDSGTTKIVYLNNSIIGYIDYFILGKRLYMKNIKILYSRQGYGRLIIKYLFDKLDIDSIYGFSINNISDCFWKCLGATFYNSDKDILNEGKFILFKDNFNG